MDERPKVRWPYVTAVCLPLLLACPVTAQSPSSALDQSGKSPVSASASEQEAAAYSDAAVRAGQLGLMSLASIESFPAEDRDAARAAITYLGKSEVPSDYYAVVESSNGQIEVQLWYFKALNDAPGVRGDPSGRCRTLTYDAASKSIVRAVWWR